MDQISQVRLARQGKLGDPAWYRVHRGLSIRLSLPLARLGARPGQVTIALMGLWLAGAALVASRAPAVDLAGFALLYLAFLLDKVDGEVARLRDLASARGVLLDRFHHRIVEPTLFLAAGWHAAAASGAPDALVAGFATALLANIIEEHQQLAPYIRLKRLREGDGGPLRRVWAPPAWRRARALLRPLKAFRTPITAMSLLLAAEIAEWLGWRAAVAYDLRASVVGLAVYLMFQCVDYYAFRLEEELAEIEAFHGRGTAVSSLTMTPSAPARPGAVSGRETDVGFRRGSEVHET